MASVRAQTAENVTILVGLQWLSRFFAFITKIVLARLLFPQDFGIFALATGLVGFVSVFGNFGLDYALIQRGDTAKDIDYDVAMSLRLVISGALFIASLVLAIPWSGLFGEPLVMPATQVLAVLYLISPWSFVPSTRLSAKLDYRALILPNVLGQSTNALVSIGLALAGFRVWSLIIGAICSQAAWGISVTLARPWRFRFRLDWAVAKPVLSYSRHLVVVSVLGFLVTNVDNFTVGYFLGTGALGFYAVAYSLCLVSTLISGSTASALFPSLSKIQGDPERLRRGYMESFGYAVATVAPAATGLALVAPELVLVLLGPLWGPSIVPLAILAFYGFARGLTDFSSSLFAAIGRPRTISDINVIVLLGSVGLLVPLTLLYGTAGTAVAMTIPVALALAFSLRWSANALGIRVRNLLSGLRGSILAAGVMGLVVYTMKVGLQWTVPASVMIPLALWHVSAAVITLIATIPVGAAVYLLVLRRVDRVLFSGLRAQLLLVLRRLRPNERAQVGSLPRD